MNQAEVRIDTRSVVFTDLVGSTEVRVRRGEDAAESVRRAHDALVGKAVAAHGGTVVKGLGDGAMVTFGSAAEAVAAAVAIQQAVELHARDASDAAFSIRVGVSVGDVTIEAGDVFGVPVVEASRLCSAATSGEILVAEVVRALSRGRGGFVFEPMGSLELKGIPEAVPACRVVWESLLDQGSGVSALPLPPTLVSGAATSYVGRTELLQRLHEQWQSVAAGGYRTVLLAGEPGVGKTRTAAELARAAHAQGALVL
jgi:class 3 adenylate cyclase